MCRQKSYPPHRVLQRLGHVGFRTSTQPTICYWKYTIGVLITVIGAFDQDDGYWEHAIGALISVTGIFDQDDGYWEHAIGVLMAVIGIFDRDDGYW